MRNGFVKVFIALVVVLFPCLGTAGQTTIREIPAVATDGSLIRNYDDGVDIVYNSLNGPAFFYVDKNSGAVTEAEIPNLQSVTDMEIVGKELYFCGEISNMPVVGRFVIPLFFFGGGQAEIVSISYTPTVNGITGVTTFNKLEVWYIDWNDVHVYVIGHITFGNPGWNIPDYTALFDCMYNGTVWSIEEIHDSGWDYRFYDLTVTASNLYVVGEKYGGGDYSNYYPLPPLPNSYILPGPSYTLSMLYVGYGQYHAIGQTLTETLYGNEFVTACSGRVEGNYGIVITHYSNPLTIVARYLIPNITGSSRFIDLKYNPQDRRLYLMPDIVSSAVTDMIYVFDLSSLTAYAYQTILPKVYSLDYQKNGDGAIVSGMTQNSCIGIWDAYKPDNGCATAISLAVHTYYHTNDQWMLDASASFPRNRLSFETPRLRTLGMEIICK